VKNERDWLNADDPRVLHFMVVKSATGRQHRLLACAGARVFWRQMGRLAHEAVEAAEQCADDPLAYPTMIEAGKALSAASTTFVGETDISVSLTSSDLAGRYCTLPEPAKAADEIVRQLARRKERRAIGCHLLREIFANPFQPPAFDPAWVSVPAVADLARHIHNEHAFEEMPNLGDALEAAGCIDPLILNHCANDDVNCPHVRGCWVLEGCLQFPEHVVPETLHTGDAKLQEARDTRSPCEECGKTVAINRVKRAGPNRGRLFRKCNHCGAFSWISREN